MTEAGDVTRRPRTASVLAPQFVEGLGALGMEEVRRRRDEALAERDFQSYLRRLVQVREDLLVAERSRRRSGATQKPVVERLTAVLSDRPGRGSPRGEAIRVSLPDADTTEAERLADSIVGHMDLSNPEALTEPEVEEATAALQRGERAISKDRAAVIRVHDLLQDELKRRFREDPSLITRDR